MADLKLCAHVSPVEQDREAISLRSQHVLDACTVHHLDSRHRTLTL
ncbi:hypothetical protein JNB63_15255 [Microbacterium trichothecenolyticum]|nr:hypothetical protein [Microbacterium trichothecenolyticum]MBW9121456.1 hypothetical protein [Microbacterium trichothecenolyticum]